MAFQPIVDVETRGIFAHEALVRSPAGASAAEVLARVDESNIYRFDQTCRVRAIERAARLGMSERLSISFLPGAVYRPETCIGATLEAAARFGFPVSRIVFEVAEGEKIEDRDHLVGIIREYRSRGMTTAIDDFGAGYAGLNLLAEFQPDILKLDMALTRSVDSDRVRRTIVLSVLAVCRELDIQVIAEGVETLAEFHTLRSAGIRLFQGYLFARPHLEGLVRPDEIAWPP
jgi:EAL domain-containing protein (putative c-di-GMP-specific phosphodiesterase class I)